MTSLLSVLARITSYALPAVKRLHAAPVQTMSSASMPPDVFTRHVATPQSVSDFFTTHPELTPKSVLQDALQPDNQRGEGGTMVFYPARQPQLQGVGFLLPRQLKKNGQPVLLPDGPLHFQPAAPTPLHVLSDVGVVLGTIGPATVVRKMPGEVVANYLDLPCPDGDSLEFLNYFHNIDRFNAMSVAERREDIQRIMADPEKAKQDRVIPLLLNPAFFKAFEGLYLKQMKRLAELDDSVYQKAVATLLKIRSASMLPDFNHPMNLLLDGQGRSAQFGFVDIQLLRVGVEMPPVETHLLGFGLNLVGGGLGYFGPLWLMVSDEAEAALNRDIPTILHKLEQAAQAQGIAFSNQDLRKAINRRTNLPSLQAKL
jgi:hypothetical protein